MLVTGCSATPDGAAERCGWDLTSREGIRANQERLDFVMSFLAENPGQTPPAIDSPYWYGDCPMPTDAPTGPPDHEDESPHDHGEDLHDHDEDLPEPIDPSADPAQQ